MRKNVKPRSVGRPSKASSGARDLKAEILVAATEHFSMLGYFATTTKEIARAVGTSESLILYHFKGKDDLYLKCLDAAESNAFVLSYKALSKALSSGDVSTKIRIVIDDVLDFFEQCPHEATMLVREIRNPALQEHCRDENALKILAEKINAFLTNAAKDGFLKTDADPSWLGLTLFTSLISIARDHDLTECFLKKNKTLKRDAVVAKLVTIVRM